MPAEPIIVKDFFSRVVDWPAIAIIFCLRLLTDQFILEDAHALLLRGIEEMVWIWPTGDLAPDD